MAIEAPVSKFRKDNLKIFIVGMLVLGAWCLYDGYFNQKWIAEHTNTDGTPQTYLTVNRQAPYYFTVGVIALGTYLLMLKNKKIIADEKELIISDKKKIAYESIQKIDKTDFESKGFFVITYTDSGNKESSLKISDKKYDNLEAVLKVLVTKIS